MSDAQLGAHVLFWQAKKDRMTKAEKKLELTVGIGT